jgi:hypothetical protein
MEGEVRPVAVQNRDRRLAKNILGSHPFQGPPKVYLRDTSGERDGASFQG